MRTFVVFSLFCVILVRGTPTERVGETLVGVAKTEEGVGETAVGVAETEEGVAKTEEEVLETEEEVTDTAHEVFDPVDEEYLNIVAAEALGSPLETVEDGSLEDAVLPPESEDPEYADMDDAAESRGVYCPPGWIGYGSRCFLIVKSAKAWYSAEDHCVQQHGSLVSVQSLREYNFLQSLLQLSGYTQAWIGAYNFQNRWRWIDRAGYYYTNWYSIGSVTSYPCGYMTTTTGWRNTNCATSLVFICALKTC